MTADQLYDDATDAMDADDLARRQVADESDDAVDVIDETAPPMPQGFRCDTEGKAEFAAELIINSAEQLARRKAALAGFIAEDERLREFFLGHLAEYFEKNPPRRGRTVKLANANLSMRTIPGGFRIVDENAVIAWARKNLRAAIVPKFTEDLAGDVVRKHFEQTGEVPPGCEIKDDSEKLYVRAPKAPKGK